MDDSPTDGKISRRDFLKLVGAGVFVAVINGFEGGISLSKQMNMTIEMSSNQRNSL